MRKLAAAVLTVSGALALSACGGPGAPADTTPPTVTLSATPSSVTSAGNVTLTATAKDNVGVTKVEFYQGATRLGTDTTPADGFTFGDAVTAANNGTRAYTAVAYDAAGNKTTSAAASVTVNIATSGAGSQTITGYLASSNSGAPVVGSTVTVDGANVNTTTDAQGRFTLNLNPGVYSVNFQKAGYAASRIEGVTVTSGANAPLNAIQKVVFASNLPIKAPTIAAKALIGADQVGFPNDPAKALKFNASAGIPIQLTVTAGDDAISPSLIYAAVGNVPGSGFFGARFNESNDPKNTTYQKTITLKGDALRGVRGASYLDLVAYDFNDNRTEQRIPVVLTDDTPNTAALGSLGDFKVRAVTIAQKVDFYAPPASKNGTSTEESSLWVDLNWNYQQGLNAAPTGYRIWTSDDGNTFSLLKTLPGSAVLGRDSSPTLAPGKKVYYYVEVYNSLGSVSSPVASTTPLDTFKLSNFGPANHSRSVSVKPELSWSVDKKVGDYRKFFVQVNDYPSQGSYCFWGNALCGDTKESDNNVYTDDGKTPALKVNGNDFSVTFNENGKAFKATLEAYHSYTMDVSAAAFSASGDAISIGQDYYSIFYSGLGTCNFGGPVCEGQLSTFTTGDGSK